MKKLLLTFVMCLGLGLTGFQMVNAAEEDPIVEEVIVEEEEPTVEEETDPFLSELNLTLASIFSWIGGISGLSALLAFVLRYIREKGLMSKLRDQIAEVQTNSVDEVAKFNDFMGLLSNSIARVDALEKAVINLVPATNAPANAKIQTLEGLKVNQVIDLNIAKIKDVQNQAEAVKAQVVQETESLLKKLTKKA